MASEVTTHSHIDRDRITITAERTYNVAQYESIKFAVGLSADRQSNETLKQAFERVETDVLNQFDRLCSKVEGNHSVKSKGGI